MKDSELIARAFASAPRAANFRLLEAARLDEHLQGHAFKYAAASSRIQGVYRYRLTYAVAGSASPRAVEVMVKAKPDEADIIRVYQGLLDHAGIKLRQPLPELLRDSDYSKPNLKETRLFRDYHEKLSPFLPPSWGEYVDEASGYTLRLEEVLPPGSLIIDPSDDTMQRWQPSFSDLTLRGIAQVHACFYGDYDELVRTGAFFVCDREVMVRGTELWEALAEFVIGTFPDVVTSELARKHRRLIATLPEWYAEVDCLPKTLLYGDVNPQNLAFALQESGGFKLSLFDWERATISVPERDLAEHLVYTLPLAFSEEEARAEIAAYVDAFGAAAKRQLVDTRASLDWMLSDLIINRLPLMMVVKHVAGKRQHAGEAYVKAHRLRETLNGRQ
ncbi:MAG: phosphotransferase [Verrucomicrobia bacterium]|nr:phosphotransferase [Verrucomicrobiota bacterium]